MIKLRSLLKEEKEAFKLEREGKIRFEISNASRRSNNASSIIIEIFNDISPSEMGHISLLFDTPYDELGGNPPKPKYLFVDYIRVEIEREGYGFLLYKEALKYAQKSGFKGLVSSKNNRTADADQVWNKLKTFSDRDYDYVDIKDLGTRITEAPVDTHQTIGDFSKGSSFTNKTDRALVTNPVAIKKVKDFFQNTSANFDFYFVNTKDARKYTEIGKVKEDFIYDKLNISPEQLKNGKINENNITVFFTNNKGDERVPLTAWVIAHRFGHVIRRDYAWDKELSQWVDEKLEEILSAYGISKKTYTPYSYGNIGSGNGNEVRKYKTAIRHLCETIGTFKSARDKNLRAEFEFHYELFAQYLKRGEVAFNPLPEVLLTGHAAFGRKKYKRLQDVESANAELYNLKNDYNYYANAVLTNCIGNIYVM